MSENPTTPHIPIHLSMDDPEPMYAQIESQLRDFILSGQLPPGTKLPSSGRSRPTSPAASSPRDGPTRTSSARDSSAPDREWGPSSHRSRTRRSGPTAANR